MKIIKRYIKLGIIVLLLSTTIPITGTVNASEENILGISIKEFDAMNIAGKRYSATLEEYSKSYELEGYQLKLKKDAYAYMYEILSLAEKLGDNQLNVINDHIQIYNKSLKPPLTEEDQIVAEEAEDDRLTITTTSSEAKEKLLNVIGERDGEGIAVFPLLRELRTDLGFTVEIVEGASADDTTMSERKINNYLRENISEIRYLFTTTKDYLIEHKAHIDDSKHSALSKYFVDTYNKVIKKSVESDIDVLKDMDLLGEKIDYIFDSEAPDAHESIGVWREGDEEEGETTYSLESLSEYMLKNIAASATFEPFQTNLNGTDAFDFLGEQNKTFHTAFGTKRKILLTPTDTYNTLNRGIDKDDVKAIKYMTLREFVKDPDKPKILFLDNLEYTLNTVENEQKAIAGEDLDDYDEDTTGIGEETRKDNKPGFFRSITTAMDKSQLWLKELNPVFDFILTEPLVLAREDILEQLVFASGDLSKEKKLSGLVDLKRNDINESYLILNNIIDHYYDKKTISKMKKDMDKPLYIDIYGNILTASGIVVIPAMSNPFMLNDSTPSMHFNRAMIESYPQYTIKKGVLIADRKSKNRMVFGMNPMTEEEIAEQEEIVGKKFKFEEAGKVIDESEGGEEGTEETGDDGIDESATGNLGEDRYGVIPGVSFHVTRVTETFKPNKYTQTNYFQPVANKFDGDYSVVKALDIWSFAKTKGGSLYSYDEVKSNVEKMEKENRKALIEDYTAKLSYAESTDGEIVTFLKVPDSKEIKRFMYITNLEHVANIEDLTILDNKTLDRDVSVKVAEEVYLNGVYELNTINSLVPDFITKIYDDYVEYLLSMANDRYESVLSGEATNNILYNKSIEEVGVLQGVLPLVYKVILLLAIISVIFYLVMTVITPENKLKQVMKIVTILYMVTFLINISGWMLDTFVNKPTSRMFTQESAFWTLVEQEKNTHQKKLVTNDEVIEVEQELGSKIKLYKIPYNYPYKMLGNTNREGNITLDEFYEHYLINDSRFKMQNNEMYVEGNYLVTDTKTVFNSSSIVVDDPEDIRLKMTHEIYYEPELAYYMPYYMFIDNIVHNLNALTEINYRIPYDIAYASGTIKTTGRMYDYLNSALFLDYDTFVENIEKYSSSDKVSEELSVAKIKETAERYGNPNDFLGIRKILNTVDDKEFGLEPFTEEGIDKVKNAGWYPQIDPKISKTELRDLERKALKVNDKVKRFMVELADVSGEVSDEHLIKTIALYASLEFNKEFSGWTGGAGPKSIELSGVPVERLLMGLSVPRTDMLDNTVVSYPNFVVENVGYAGLLLSGFNDLMIVFINYIKPFMTVVIWVMAGLMIFIKKVVIPDPNNRSIIGSLKIMMYFILSSVIYAGALVFIIKAINSNGHIVVGQLLLMVTNLLYIFAIIFMIYTLIVDGANMGSSILFKGLENAVKAVGNTLQGAVQGVPIFDKFFGKQTGRLTDGVRHLERHFEQKSLKSSERVGSVGIKTPIDFGMGALKSMGSTVTNKIKGNKNPTHFDNSYSNAESNKQARIINLPDDRRTIDRGRDYQKELEKQQREERREQQLKQEYMRDREDKNSKSS